METNAIKCKYRVKHGWFLFGKYRCEMSLHGKKWTASKAVCNGCDGPMLETVHSCTYFKIGTDKPYNDRNTVVVKGYCFRIYKDEKDFRNEIKDLETCNPQSPKCLPCYQARPITETHMVPKRYGLFFKAKRFISKGIQLNIFARKQFIGKRSAIILAIVIVAIIGYSQYKRNDNAPLPESHKSEGTKEPTASLSPNKPTNVKDHRVKEEPKKQTFRQVLEKNSNNEKTQSYITKTEEQHRLENIRQYIQAGNGYLKDKKYNKALENFNKALEIDPDNKEARGLVTHIEKQKQNIKDYLVTGNFYLEKAEKGQDNIGLYDKATELFKKVLEIDPDNQEALYGIKKSNEKSTVQVKNITGPKTTMEAHSNIENKIGPIVDPANEVKSNTTNLTRRYQGELTTDLTHGKKVFSANCVVCHGEKGNGKGPAFAAMNPKPTDFTDSAVMRRIDDARLKKSIKEGRPGTAMVGFGKTLNDKDIEDVIRYIKSFFNN